MKITRTKPRVPKSVETPQCCVPSDESKFASHYLERRKKRAAAIGYDPARCTRPSSYLIDGRPYCTQHAGQIALQQMLTLLDGDN